MSKAGSPNYPFVAAHHQIKIKKTIEFGTDCGLGLGIYYKCDLNGTYRYVLGAVGGYRTLTLFRGLLAWWNGNKYRKPQVVSE